MIKDFTKEDIKNYLKKFEKSTDNSIQVQILEFFDKASCITKLSFSDLVKSLDFAPNDDKIEKLESFLAELRSIFFLNNFGFSNIEPISAGQTKQPDFAAYYKNKSSTIEIFSFTEIGSEIPDLPNNTYLLNDRKLISCFVCKAMSKKAQLDAICSENKQLICVINDLPYSNLFSRNEYEQFLKEISKILNWGDNYYFGILTGKTDAFTDLSDDIIYPNLK